jgi:RNA polymerase sigma-70 factor, ECF subfamily
VTKLDADLLRQIKQGDDLAFTTLIERFQRPVLNLCFRMLGNQQEAEDAAQETFWRAYQGINKYDPNRSFSTWLLSIAAHHCIDLHRHRSLPSFSMDVLPEGNIPDSSPNPEKSVMDALKQAQVQQVISLLKPEDRAMIILFYWYDFSELEIGKALSLSVSAVKSRLHRIRKQLATLWRLSEKQFSPAMEGK